jgi:hypothetical protein
MYAEKLAVAIKSNGKILRETKDLVHLPFGSEFSVLVKNLNSRRVKFTLHIDGADALDGTEIIVNANSETELKRFIRNGNMDEGNAFKFIERTSAIEDGPRGIKVDDGVVRIEFWFEQERQEIKIKDIYYEKHYYRDYHPHIPTWYGPLYGTYNCVGSSNISGSIADNRINIRDVKLKGATASSQTLNQVSQQNTSFSAVESTFADTEGTFADTSDTYTTLAANIPVNDIGITVPGSKIEQKFNTVYGFKPETQSHTIVLRLVGVIGNIEVAAPVTVKSKQKCVTCGKVNKATSKFCSDCGTALELL